MVIVNEERCARCGQCHLICPVDAIHGWSFPIIDKEECIECLECIDWCLADALEEVAE